MKLIHCGFLFKGAGMKAEEHRAMMESPSFTMSIRGVENLDMAIEAAKDLVANGVQLIELCGGFNESMTRSIIKAINGAVPVAAVEYLPEEQAKLDHFLAS